jgi:hypothetical protein
MTFPDKFHEAVSKVEKWIEAEPFPCLSCGKPYSVHTTNPEDGREESCLLDGYTDTYCNPEHWESYAEFDDEDERAALKERAMKLMQN